MAALWPLPVDLHMKILFYVPTRNLINLSETNCFFARLCREYLRKRRDTLEGSEKPLAKSLESLVDWTAEDNTDKNRFDDLTELFDKCHDGLDVMREHATRTIPIRERIKLEAELISRVEEGFEYIKECCRLFHERNAEEIDSEHHRCRFLISSLDRLYGEVHNQFLELYLQT